MAPALGAGITPVRIRHPAPSTRIYYMTKYHLVYETPCDMCGGTGTFDLEIITTPSLQITPKECQLCKGKGLILTREGKELVDFLKRYV
jgi:hypothetical protein